MNWIWRYLDVKMEAKEGAAISTDLKDAVADAVKKIINNKKGFAKGNINFGDRLCLTFMGYRDIDENGKEEFGFWGDIQGMCLEIKVKSSDNDTLCEDSMVELVMNAFRERLWDYLAINVDNPDEWSYHKDLIDFYNRYFDSKIEVVSNVTNNKLY